ncbi:unnamed protein product, partial [Brenthis ino]
MAPKKKKEPPIRCDEIQGERFSAPTEDVFSHNWWEVFCFPYILCGRIWDCFVSLCSGTNQCLVYWMMIQWIVCKITKLTTPDAIVFPYYFYMFCQVILLTAFFVMLWIFFGKSVVIPYFEAFYAAIIGANDSPSANTTRLSFRSSGIFNYLHCIFAVKTPVLGQCRHSILAANKQIHHEGVGSSWRILCQASMGGYRGHLGFTGMCCQRGETWHWYPFR